MRQQSVAIALASSCAVIAAYCRADAVANLVPQDHLSRFPGFLQVQQRAAPPGTPVSSSEIQISTESVPRQSDWLQLRTAKRQKILVGLARASSDKHFVGTLDAAMVHPGLQRRGLGRRCVLCDAQA